MLYSFTKFNLYYYPINTQNNSNIKLIFIQQNEIIYPAKIILRIEVKCIFL